jgi:hypothetical protein
MARKKDATSLVEATRAMLAEVRGKVAALTSKRETALLGSDDKAVDALDAELAELRKQAGRHGERIGLLTIQVEREAGERRLRERAGLIERFAKKLNDADAIAVELQDDVARAEKKFRAIISLREEARAAFAVHSSHAQAAAGAPEGCAMAGGAVATLLAFELYRIGYKPFLGGGPHMPKATFPGALCPRTEWTLQPEKITPFAEALKRGSEFAVELLRTELALPPAGPEPEPLPAAPAMNGNGAAVPQPATAAIETPPPPGASATLAELLARQNTLAADPSREAEYLEVVKKISALQ